jgi:hypothetical protein
MSKVQDVFMRIQKSLKEQREVKSIYRESLEQHQEYKKIVDEQKSLKDRKKKIEDSIKDDFRSEFDKLDTLKLDIENDRLLLSDAALSQLMKGETVEVVDEKEQKYEPIFSVKFKKS